MTLRVIVIAVGVVMGIIIQSVLTLTVANGAWDKMSPRNRAGVRLTGGVAALLSGFFASAFTASTDPNTAIWWIWGFQAVAAAGGSESIRWMIQRAKQVK